MKKQEYEKGGKSVSLPIVTSEHTAAKDDKIFIGVGYRFADDHVYKQLLKLSYGGEPIPNEIPKETSR